MAESAPTSPRFVHKSYFLIPCVLLGGFLLFERHFQQEREIREREVAVRVAAAKRDQEATREKLRADALADQVRRTAEREQQEREREEKKQREYDTALQKLEAETTRQLAAAEKLEQEIAEVDAILVQRRGKKEELGRQTSELAQQVEKQQVERRTVEMETQRTLQMVLGRLFDTRWATSPTLTPPPPKK